MNITKDHILSNGLRILQCKLPHTHSVSIDLFVRAGTEYEKAEQNGITHLLEHIHFRELNGMTQDQLYYYMESLGTTLRAETYRNFLRFQIKVIPTKLFEASEIFIKILTTYNWSDNALEKEQAVVLRQIEEKSSYTIDNYAYQSIFGNIPIAMPIMGNKNTVSKITSKDLTDYKNKIFNNHNMIISFAGNFNDTEILKVEKTFETIRINTGMSASGITVPANFHKRAPNILIETNGWSVYDIDLSFDVDLNTFSLEEVEILNCILGEGVGSKLQKYLREELGLTADISSFVDKYEKFSIIHIQYSIDKSEFEKSLYETINVLRQMKSNISTADLAVSIPFYNEALDFYLDDTSEINFLNCWYGFILNKSFEKTTIRCDEQERFMTLAQKIFKNKNLTLTVMGDISSDKKEKIKNILVKLDD